MKNFAIIVFAIVAAPFFAGCNSRDKEEVAKKSNGTETFQFDKGAAEKAKEQSSIPAPVKAAAPKSAKGDGTDSFKFDASAVQNGNDTSKSAKEKAGK